MENKHLSEEELDEAMPQGFLSRMWNGMLSKLGGLAPNTSMSAKGKLEAGKAANQLMNAYKQALGRANKTPTVGTLMSFLQRYNYDTNSARKELGLSQVTESNSLRRYMAIMNEDSDYNKPLSDGQVAKAIMAAVIDNMSNSEFGSPPQQYSTTSSSCSQSSSQSTQQTSDAEHMAWLLNILRRSDPTAFNAAVSGTTNEEMVVETDDEPSMPRPISKAAISKVSSLQDK